MNSLPLFPELPGGPNGPHPAGILPRQDLRELVARGCIRAALPIQEEQLQPSSLDLRLGPVAYQVQASFLPTRTSTVLSQVGPLQVHELDLTRPAVLHPGCVYVIPLLEQLELPEHLYGKTNPKSTTGRLDIFVRLLTDYNTEFERILPGYRGKLYAEVAPRTFSVIVRQGDKLNQVRLIGTPRDSVATGDPELSLLHDSERLIFLGEGETAEPFIEDGLWVSVNLAGSAASRIVGYRAKRYAPVIDLARINHYDPRDFWDPIERSKRRELILHPGEFYILASRERVRVPPEFAAEMVGYDPSVGEFRIHYAGFFDPGFGYSGGVQGTRAVLEVRSHEVPFLLQDGQRVGRLIYERLRAVPDKLYGADLGSSYQQQGLALSKQFRLPRR